VELVFGEEDGDAVGVEVGAGVITGEFDVTVIDFQYA